MEVEKSRWSNVPSGNLTQHTLKNRLMESMKIRAPEPSFLSVLDKNESPFP